MALTWDDLAAASVARQFPDARGTVAERVHAIGDLQTQTARSAFIGLGARFPGVTRAEIVAAYEAGGIVRGSTIRGTVHTASPEAYTVLAEATRVGQHGRWARLLGITEEQMADLWASVEDHAREWRTPDELRAHVADWLARHAPASLEAAASGPGRYLGFAHGALVRRPASGDSWEGQCKPVYATFERTGPATLAVTSGPGLAMSARARSSSRVTSCAKRALSAAMLSRKRRRSSGLMASPWSCSSSTAPPIPASGVLNSWLTAAAKSRR